MHSESWQGDHGLHGSLFDKYVHTLEKQRPKLHKPLRHEATHVQETPLEQHNREANEDFAARFKAVLGAGMESHSHNTHIHYTLQNHHEEREEAAELLYFERQQEILARTMSIRQKVDNMDEPTREWTFVKGSRSDRRGKYMPNYLRETTKSKSSASGPMNVSKDPRERAWLVEGVIHKRTVSKNEPLPDCFSAPPKPPYSYGMAQRLVDKKSSNLPRRQQQTQGARTKELDETEDAGLPHLTRGDQQDDSSHSTPEREERQSTSLPLLGQRQGEETPDSARDVESSFDATALTPSSKSDSATPQSTRSRPYSYNRAKSSDLAIGGESELPSPSKDNQDGDGSRHNLNSQLSVSAKSHGVETPRYVSPGRETWDSANHRLDKSGAWILGTTPVAGQTLASTSIRERHSSQSDLVQAEYDEEGKLVVRGQGNGEVGSTSMKRGSTIYLQGHDGFVFNNCTEKLFVQGSGSGVSESGGAVASAQSGKKRSAPTTTQELRQSKALDPGSLSVKGTQKGERAEAGRPTAREIQDMIAKAQSAFKADPNFGAVGVLGTKVGPKGQAGGLSLGVPSAGPVVGSTPKHANHSAQSTFKLAPAPEQVEEERHPSPEHRSHGWGRRARGESDDRGTSLPVIGSPAKQQSKGLVSHMKLLELPVIAT